MNITNIAVIVRVSLYVVAGVMMRGGWLPSDAAIMFADPALVELLSGIILAILTGIFTVGHESKKPEIKTTVVTTTDTSTTVEPDTPSEPAAVIESTTTTETTVTEPVVKL